MSKTSDGGRERGRGSSEKKSSEQRRSEAQQRARASAEILAIFTHCFDLFFLLLVPVLSRPKNERARERERRRGRERFNYTQNLSLSLSHALFSSLLLLVGRSQAALCREAARMSMG